MSHAIARVATRGDLGDVVAVFTGARHEHVVPYDPVAGESKAVVQPRRSVPQAELGGRPGDGPERSRRPVCGPGPGVAQAAARPVGDREVRASPRVRDCTGDDQAGVGLAPPPAASPLLRTAAAVAPGTPSRRGASAEAGVQAVAPGADRSRPRRVLRVPAGTVADLPGPPDIPGRPRCARRRRAIRRRSRGPAELLFDHPDVRVYVDNLFLEGALRLSGGRVAADAASARTRGRRVVGRGPAWRSTRGRTAGAGSTGC